MFNLKALLLASVSALALHGCAGLTTQQGVTVLGGTAGLAKAKVAYESSKSAIKINLHLFSPDDQAKLVSIGEQADSLLDEIAARTDNTIDLFTFLVGDARFFYQRAVRLYASARALVQPYYTELNWVTQTALRDLDIQMGRLDAAYELYQSNPDAAAAGQIVEGAVSGVTLAVGLAELFVL